MRRQVTVGSLMALALLTGSVVAFAHPPVPADCAPADTGTEQRAGLVPEARAQDDPDEDASADEPADAASDEPDEDPDPAGDPPGEGPDQPAADEPAEDDPEPPADEPGADDPAGDDPSGDEPAADEPGADDPAGDDPPGDGPADVEPGADDPAGGDPSGGEPAGEAPTSDDPATDPASGADDPAGDSRPSGVDPCDGDAEPTAAAALDWGDPTREDDFDGRRLDRTWEVYRGTGFDGQGTRTSEALTVKDGVLTITGDAEGATGGMAWGPGRMYGRWEARVRTPEADPSYNALLLLWPDDESGAGSEVDFMEMIDPDRQTANGFLHSDGETVEPLGEVAVDATRWHTWAVEWTPTSITAYLDGAEWWTVDDPDLLPQGPMHLCVQLDWFPTDEGESVQESSMQVDWVREYAVDAPAADDRAGDEEPADDPADGDDPAGDDTGDDGDGSGDTGDPSSGDDVADDGDGSGDPGSGDDAADDGDAAGDADDPDSGDGDRGVGDRGDGDDSRSGDSEQAPSLREGAPDSPARAGLVTGAAAAPGG